MLTLDSILSRNSFLLGLELKVFWITAFVYGLAFFLFAVHILSRKYRIGKAAQSLLWVAVAVHTGLIILRTFEAQRAPFQTLYESLSWFAWSGTVTYLLVSMKWKRIYLPGAFVSGLSMGACLYALLSRSPAIDTLTPPLQSNWFEYHVVLAFFSYAVFVVSASIEMTYLCIKPLLDRGAKTLYGLTEDNIEKFHKGAFSLILFGYPLLTFAIFSGAAWANEAWGRYWSWDPKETWSLITWTVFTLYLHSRAIPSLKGLPASLFNILGFICMLMTFLGVNWLARLLGIPSLHIYAV